MMDEKDIKRADIGDEIMMPTGRYEIRTGIIKEFSPTRARMKVEWDTGRTSVVHHTKYGNVTLADHRQRRRKHDP